MSHRSPTHWRKSVLLGAILAALGADTMADLAGLISGGSGAVQYGDDVSIQGDLAGGTADISGLRVDGDAQLIGNTQLNSPDGTTAVTLSDGLIEGTVSNAGGGENGLIVTGTDASLSGGADSGNTLLLIDQDGVRITGEAESLGNLAVAGVTNTNGLTNTGAITNTGDLASTGSSSLTSSDGTANLSVSDGDAGLTVQTLAGGANGLIVNAADTTLAGGDDTGSTALLLTQDGVTITGNGSSSGALAVTGGLTSATLATGTLTSAGLTNTGDLASTGSSSLTSSDGTANLSVTDGDAGLTVQTLAGGANGLIVNAADTTLAGGDDTGSTALLLTQDGVTITGNGSSSGALAVTGGLTSATLATGTLTSAGLTNTGDLASTGSSSLTSSDGTANLSVSDGDAGLTVQTLAGGANGLIVNAADTTLAGGDDTGSTALLLTQDGVTITGNGSSSGALAVTGGLTSATLATGTLTSAGLTNTGDLASTGSSSLTSSDGTANLSVSDGDAGLTVQTLAGGANGLIVNAADTTLAGGDDTGSTALLLTQDGVTITGNGSSSGALAVTGGLTSATLATGTLTSAGNATIGGGLVVAGTTTLQDATRINNTLNVTGQTNTNGITNTGNLTNTGNAAVLGGFAVGGTTTLQGATRINNALTVTGQTNTSGITNTGGFRTTGDATLTSTDGTAGVIVTNGAASLLVRNQQGGLNGIAVTPQGTTITGVGPTTIRSENGKAGITVSNGQTTVGVQNASGGTNGLAVTATGTRITGGTGTTQVDVTDGGVAITGTGPSRGDLSVQGTTTTNDLAIRGNLSVAPGRTLDFGGNRLQGIGDGVAATDAVNRGQLDDVRTEARRGVAIAAALDTLLPDPGKRFRVNLGGGYYNGESAIGLTGAGRITDDVAVYIGVGADTDFEETAGKIGVSYQW